MITHQVALIRRELWEHRSIWITPAAVALVMSLMVLTGYIFASGYQDIIDVGIVGAENFAADSHRRAGLLAFLVGDTVVFIIAAGVLTIFYCLDCLYAERKNKSILFWRSLPITDAETVISKFLTAIIAIPMVFLGVIVVAHLVLLLITSIFISIEGGDSMLIIWKSAPLFDVWAALFIVMLALPLWFSPFIGWFMLVSAWAKRSVLLTAFLPLIVVPMIETWIFPTHILWDAIRSRFEQLPIFGGIHPETFFDEEALREGTQQLSLLAMVDVGRFLTSPAMWAGLIVCGALITAAIYVRRYRDDS